MDQSDELIVPLVNGPHQRAAVERAIEASPSADVTVLNVVTPLDEPFSEGRVLPVTEDRREAARARARRLVEAETGRRGMSVEIAVAEGRPVRTVVERAEERDADRIVVGAREPSRLSRVLFGRSVAGTIDDLTDVPVTRIDEPS